MGFEAQNILFGTSEPNKSARGTEHELEAALHHAATADWSLPSGFSLTRLCESENATFLAVAPDGGRTVLRVHRHGYNDAAEIGSEHAWIAALRQERTVATPEVLRRRDGGTVGRIAIDGGDRHVAAFAFMTGREPAVDEGLPPWFEKLGTLTARLHAQSQAWRRPAGFSRKVWNFDSTLGARPHWGDWRLALGLDAEGRRLLERAVGRIESRLAGYGTGERRFGLIHADLRLANLLVEHERLGVIDFDDCGFGWFMYDFAASVSFIEHDPVVDELRAAWIEGYRAEAPLDAADEAILGVMVMLRRILLTAWIASRPAATIAAELGAPFTAGTLELAERFLRLDQPSS